ncbi:MULTISPECIES: hypothetical protein [unclassified Bradyrhizobium]|uniref:hypothetical protein n=1 Tax=unclassified Bradyrhizobium TaxID=2631580 RepID=UPI001FF7D8D6|nr:MULTISPECIES: hypothetical protein [unclassified Bradyrhizobium]MCK1424592.1 hypothetical protein [Bradyrhizobium sp. CW12]MCK1646455.1 hypothetical protein [Bradyrhizobium sp. 154]
MGSPIRFGAEGIEIHVNGKRYSSLPGTVALICTISLTAFWAATRGTGWSAFFGWIVIVAPLAFLVGALIWFGALAHAEWLFARWYRAAVGIVIAVVLVVLEAGEFRLPSGEKLNGYVWAAIILVVLAIGAVARWRMSEARRR